MSHSNTVLPDPPIGTFWVERGCDWTNGGVPTIHCVKIKRRVVMSKVALAPAGGASNFFWEAVAIGEIESKGAEAFNGELTTSPTSSSSKSIEVVLLNPKPESPETLDVDPQLEVSWDAWRLSPQGVVNINVRGIDVSRLWAIMESRVKASFEAGYRSRKTS